MYKYIIASDLHLGTKHSKAKEFLQFIEENPCEQLILNGDIIDGWALQRGTKWRTSHTKVIAKLIKLSTKQKVVWIRGNHDDFLKDFVGTNLGNIKIREDYVITADKKYFIFHGDIIDVFITQYGFLAKIGSVGYDVALFLNDIYNLYRKWRKLPYYSISQKIKEGVKIATNYVNDFETTAIRMASDKMCDGVICGHIHQPADRMIGKKHYLNSGDWVENMTAICIKLDNTIEIKSFK
jgi:UDP-2,3-diacylglucosamine pyrophosphatase LpxH